MRLSKRQIADIRAGLCKGGLDAALLAAQLLEMLEKLQVALDAAESGAAEARRDLQKAVAALAEQRLAATGAQGSERQKPNPAPSSNGSGKPPGPS